MGVLHFSSKQVPVSESSIRRKLQLKDDEGISDLPDTDLFANLSQMGYNILPNQIFSFQKGQFTHQWKFLIHTIMQCLSPKSTAFNEFSSNIATAIVCLATNRIYNFSKMIFDGMITNIKRHGSKKFLMYPRFLEKLLKMSQFGEIKHTETYPVPSQTAKVFTTLRVNSPSFSGRNVDLFESMLVPQGEGPVNPTEPHHTPSPQASFPQSQEPIPHKTTTLTSSQEPTSQQISTPSHTPTPRRLTKSAIRIAQSKALTPRADESTSPPRDDKQAARDAKIARLHTEGELKMIIDELDRSNEVIAKHLKEYAQAEDVLSLEDKIELITELAKYHKDLAQIKKYQA
ncbi:hypothetical protein Tco_0641469 [Tanacetum coccineum]